jgi:hypothetical protein
MPRYEILSTQVKVIPFIDIAATLRLHLGPMCRQWDFLVSKVMPRTLPSEIHRSNICCKSITDAECKRISSAHVLHPT